MRWDQEVLDQAFQEVLDRAAPGGGGQALPLKSSTLLAPYSAGEDDEAIAARREWEAGERRRLEAPRLVLLRTQSNQ